MPHLSLKPEYITAIVAIFGATISPYLFFWQASREVEDPRADHDAKPLLETGSQAPSSFRRIRTDTLMGMGISNIVAFFIMLTTAATLSQHGITDIQTSAQAATALRPIAGEFAFLVFSAGIIGTGLLAVPVLAGSAAYALSGAFRWQNSLEYKPEEAKGFYGIIALSSVLGIALCFAPIDPIKALYSSAAINGVISAKRDSIVIAELCKVHHALSVLHESEARFADNRGNINLQREIETLERALRLLGME